MEIDRQKQQHLFRWRIAERFSQFPEDKKPGLLVVLTDCCSSHPPAAKALVEKSRAAGHDVVLVSGALEVVLQQVAKYLGADEVIGNRLEMKAGIATGKLLKPVVAGPEKARLIREHAKVKGYDLAECFAFSDSYSDVPMLSVVASRNENVPA